MTSGRLLITSGHARLDFPGALLVNDCSWTASSSCTVTVRSHVGGWDHFATDGLTVSSVPVSRRFHISLERT